MKRPSHQHDLVYGNAPREWLEGIPIANGTMGAMIWGDGKPLRFTLDHYGVWETRTPWPGDDPRLNFANLRRLKEEGRIEELKEVALRRRNMRFTDNPPPIPTRLSLGRMEIEWLSAPDGFSARLELFRARAGGSIEFARGRSTFSSFICSTRDVLVMDIRCSPRVSLPQVRLAPAPKDKQTEVQFRSWNYPEPEIETKPWGQILHRRYSVSKEYSIAAKEIRATNRLTVFLSIIPDAEGSDTAGRAARQLDEAQRLGISRLLKEHEADWARYWNQSDIRLPDARLEKLYYTEMYKHYCLSRPGKCAITLQGLWTSDGASPPWRGSYTTDMNVEESYWPAYTANHLDSGKPLYDMYWRNLPYHRKLGGYFYGKELAVVSGEHGPGGEPFPGYPTDEHSPGLGAWIAHHFWLHWLYSRNRQFLRERAYPFLREMLQAYLHIIEKRDDGKVHIPFTDTPEYHEGDPASLGDDTTFDLMLLRFLLDALLSAQPELPQRDPDRDRWLDVQKHLVDYPTAPAKWYGLPILALRAGEPLSQSHRHHSHLIGIYPLGVLHPDQSREVRDLIEGSLSDWIAKGTGRWSGWSFPWASLIAGRAGKAAMAHSFLQIYLDTFVTTNGFHVNGDFKNRGINSDRQKNMTLEAGFAAAAAILEMLLQSHHGLIRIFPTCPSEWSDVQFANLRAEGAFLVSARKSRGELRLVEIVSEAGGVCCIQNSFGGDCKLMDLEIRKSRTLRGTVLRFRTKRGGRYRLAPVTSRG